MGQFADANVTGMYARMSAGAAESWRNVSLHCKMRLSAGFGVNVRGCWHGTVHYHNGSLLLGSVGRTIYSSTDGGVHWRQTLRIPTTLRERMMSSHRLARRLFRQGIHHILPVTGDHFVVFAFGRTYDISLHSRNVIAVSPRYVGSRPLVPCVRNNQILYGEYRANAERTPVHLYSRSFSEHNWRTVVTLNGVRHIHGVFQDPFSDDVYVTTGDNDSECGIWRIEIESGTVTPLVGGTQQCRVVQLLIDRDYFYFGTDAPSEQNAIYRMQRGKWSPELRASISGPAFYGMKSPAGIFISTAVEPSAINKDQCSRVYCSRDGASWSEFAAFRKDIMPKKFFQYGQVRFPSGPGAVGYCWLTPVSTVGDQISLCFDQPRL